MKDTGLRKGYVFVIHLVGQFLVPVNGAAGYTNMTMGLRPRADEPGLT